MNHSAEQGWSRRGRRGFVTPHGTEFVDLLNPATGEPIGQVRLVDEVVPVGSLAVS